MRSGPFSHVLSQIYKSEHLNSLTKVEYLYLQTHNFDSRNNLCTEQESCFFYYITLLSKVVPKANKPIYRLQNFKRVAYKLQFFLVTRKVFRHSSKVCQKSSILPKLYTGTSSWLHFPTVYTSQKPILFCFVPAGKFSLWMSKLLSQ